MNRTEHATALGADHGKSAATWVEIDGPDAARRILAMIEDGDPALEYPAPFSGEFADSYSLLDMYEEIGVDVDEVADYLTDVFADAYESAYLEAWEAEIVRVCRYQLRG